MKKYLSYLGTLCLILSFASCSMQDNEIKPALKEQSPDDVITTKTRVPFCPCNKSVTIEIWADGGENDAGTATVLAVNPDTKVPTSCPGFSVNYFNNSGNPITVTGSVKGHTSGLIYGVQNSSNANARMRFEIEVPPNPPFTQGGTYSTGTTYMQPDDLFLIEIPYYCFPFGS